MSKQNLKLYFFNILQKRDYSEKELRDKAVLKRFEFQEINLVIQELKSMNFINDRRLVENLLELYSGKKGGVWLKQKLMLRKIDKSLIDSVMDQPEQAIVEVVPDESFKNKLERKYKINDWNEIDPSTKQKLARYILSQGFTRPFEIIKKWTNNSLD